jgi:hypothetical protein
MMEAQTQPDLTNHSCHHCCLELPVALLATPLLLAIPLLTVPLLHALLHALALLLLPPSSHPASCRTAKPTPIALRDVCTHALRIATPVGLLLLLVASCAHTSSNTAATTSPNNPSPKPCTKITIVTILIHIRYQLLLLLTLLRLCQLRSQHAAAAPSTTVPGGPLALLLHCRIRLGAQPSIPAGPSAASCAS